jgi:hypothetical protein
MIMRNIEVNSLLSTISVPLVGSEPEQGWEGVEVGASPAVLSLMAFLRSKEAMVPVLGWLDGCGELCPHL